MKVPRKRIDLDRKPRKCLGYCGKTFPSTGPNNRICADCKLKQQGVYAIAKEHRILIE